jgi:2-keto-4-pentenoate hydratase/2-oxohepta-3-ene-1,7-dioic acid hydratase in catechol pathway
MLTQQWLRFAYQDEIGFGLLNGDVVEVHHGNMFENPTATPHRHALKDIKLLSPCVPSKVIALWNNFKALGDKLQLSEPAEPLYFLKAPNSWLNPGETIRKPAQDGKVVYEGELAIVIGKTASAVSEAQAGAHIFGYTCANDVTHAEILNRDSTFAQWVRAKSFDTFCPLGPVIATGLDPATLVVRTHLNGEIRQNFPISDMRMTAVQLVSKISHDMTLVAGDVILCGTSIGVGSMKSGSAVAIEIAGIGTLSNDFF